MNKIDCRHETAVNQALENDSWPPELLDHMAQCVVCSDLLLVSKFFQRHAETIAPEAPVPDPSFIWWRAQMKARLAAANRATRVIRIVQRLAISCGALLAVLAIIRSAPLLKTWILVLVPDSIPNQLPPNMAQPGLVMIASLAVLVFLLVFDRIEIRPQR